MKLGHVALDGTKIKANASKHKAMSYERMEKRAAELEAEVERWLSAAEAADAEEDRAFGRDKSGEELPKWVADKKKRVRNRLIFVFVVVCAYPRHCDTLDEEPATQFLLERTADDRQRAKDDEAQAHTLARELGGLALGLEQAGAQIAAAHISFARYLKLWNDNREKALGWSDPTMIGAERTLATTWATSVARLSAESLRLLDRLAMLAPDPIPDSLLDVPVPGEAADYDVQKARAELFAYSLIAQAKSEDNVSMGLVVHRLVQDFARRAMSEFAAPTR